MKSGEVGLLLSVLLWALVHPLQAEHRDLFIRKLGARGYLTSRYVLNLAWLGGNIVWSGLLYGDSERLWSGSTTASAAMHTFSVICLVAILLIPGSPVATNSKIAHCRHDDMVDGSHDYAKNTARASVQLTPAQLSSLCKLTNQPQLIAVFLYVAGMLIGPVRMCHVVLWAPQLALIAVGIPLQLRRMGKDTRYQAFLLQTHAVPLVALARGSCSWTRRDSCVLLAGLAPAALVTAALLALPLSSVFAPGCLIRDDSWAETHNCHVMAMALEYIYIAVLVLAAELGARFGVYLLPVGRGSVQGRRLCDIEGMIDRRWFSEGQVLQSGGGGDGSSTVVPQ